MKILNLEPEGYSLQARDILVELGQVIDGPMTAERLAASIGEYDVLIVRLGHKIDARLLGDASKLKAIVSATTGLNHIDLDAAQARGVEVLSLKGETEFLDTVSATAEHAWGLLLALCRNTAAAHADAVGGHWRRDLFKGYELLGKTIGVVGYGRLGRKVARYAGAFGMTVLICDVKDTADDRQVDLETLLAQSDIVSIHADYNESSHRLIDGKKFSLMKPGAYFVNTARGEIVDEDALLFSLQNGALGGAAIDVIDAENKWSDKIASHPLAVYAASHSNLLITPHIGGATYESMEKTEIFMARKLEKFLAGTHG